MDNKCTHTNSKSVCVFVLQAWSLQTYVRDADADADVDCSPTSGCGAAIQQKSVSLRRNRQRQLRSVEESSILCWLSALRTHTHTHTNTHNYRHSQVTKYTHTSNCFIACKYRSVWSSKYILPPCVCVCVCISLQTCCCCCKYLASHKFIWISISSAVCIALCVFLMRRIN